MSLPPFPDAATVRELVRYEPETGKLYWRFRPARYFPSTRYQKIWNSRQAETEAFNRLNDQSYFVGTLLGVPRAAHRVAWLCMEDELPPEIDHINGDSLDNRWCNLAASDRQENAKNQKLYANNTSGCSGVVLTAHGTWRAQIAVGRSRKVSLGTFRTKEEAIAARRAAERQHGYSERHGTPGASNAA